MLRKTWIVRSLSYLLSGVGFMLKFAGNNRENGGVGEARMRMGDLHSVVLFCCSSNLFLCFKNSRSFVMSENGSVSCSPAFFLFGMWAPGRCWLSELLKGSFLWFCVWYMGFVHKHCFDSFPFKMILGSLLGPCACELMNHLGHNCLFALSYLNIRDSMSFNRECSALMPYLE